MPAKRTKNKILVDGGDPVETSRSDELLGYIDGEIAKPSLIANPAFSLPVGTLLLASSQMYTQQAFRFGSRAYGLQFHVEPNADTCGG